MSTSRAPLRTAASPKNLGLVVSGSVHADGADGAVMPKRYSGQILQDAADYWEPRAGHKLSREDARQILENLTGFFETLAAWGVERREGRPAGGATSTAECRDASSPADNDDLGSRVCGIPASLPRSDEKETQN